MKWLTIPVFVTGLIAMTVGLVFGGYISLQPAQWEKAWVENLRAFGPAVSAIASFLAASVAIGIALFGEKNTRRRFLKSLKKDYQLDRRANERQQSEWQRQNDLNWANLASEQLTVLRDFHEYISQKISLLESVLKTDDYDLSAIQLDADKNFKLDASTVRGFEDKFTRLHPVFWASNAALFKAMKDGWKIPIFTEITDKSGQRVPYYDRSAVFELIDRYRDYLKKNEAQTSEILDRLKRLNNLFGPERRDWS